MAGPSQISIGKMPGMLRLGVIVGFEPDTLSVQVYIGSFKEYNAYRLDYNNLIQAQLPVSHYSPITKMFIGGYPENGTPVIMGQAEGNEWYILSMLAASPTAQNTLLPFIPDMLESGAFILQKDDKFIRLDDEEGIVIGEHNNNVTFDTSRDIISDTFDNNYRFTEAGRTIEGIIKRDTFPNANYPSSLKETSLDYNDTLKTIALDPIAEQNSSNIGSAIRNPARTEKREVIYEFGRSFNVLSNDQEFLSYKDSKNININDVINRRETRADALSLSLVSPNYLIESIKGTVVDIYGNVLDINRSIIPIGGTDNLSIRNVKTNLDETSPLGNVYKNIQTLERREIAYHFEINAKKNSIGPPSVTDRSNYARQRSRFFLDIDKEGLLKLNVPASSETGNIPLLTRYENYSTVSPNSKTNDPNDLVFNQNSQDILIESFIGDNAVISIIDSIDGYASPIDRFSPADSQSYIKHGTAYHDLSKTISSFQDNKSIYERITTTSIAKGFVPDKVDIVSKTVKISGDDANGGGRSAAINFDGSLELNVGANTIDRNSVTLDTQGSIIGNVGRDLRNNISLALSLDGEMLIQSGGNTPNLDTRFINPNVNNGNKPGVIDFRVINSAGEVSFVRIDNEGLSVHSESRIIMYSNGDMIFRSTGKIVFEGEDVQINSRKVRKDAGLGSI